MARWEPNAEQRLQHAALSLFHERGYDDVTVAEITERAGVTKRTFFNHFADKREVLFAGAKVFQAGIIGYLEAAPQDASPIEAAISALTRGGLDLASYGEAAKTRREVIAASIDLQERNLVKLVSLADDIAEALRDRGTPDRIAILAAKTAVDVFDAAFDEWVVDSTADFAALMQQTLLDLRSAVG